MSISKELREIAFDIPSAYQREAIGEIANRIEQEYMELPLDKDGKVIHVGDKMAYGTGRMRVKCVGIGQFTDETDCVHDAEIFSHVGRETYEQIADGISERYTACEYFGNGEKRCDNCEHNGRCVYDMAIDIIRRCEAAGESNE